MKAEWPPVLPASYPQPPELVEEYSGLRKGDYFHVKGERNRIRFAGADSARDHLYGSEVDRSGHYIMARCIHGNRLSKRKARGNG